MADFKEELAQMAKMLREGHGERKAFIMMPSFEGFDIYEVSEKSAKMALSFESISKEIQPPLTNH